MSEQSSTASEGGASIVGAPAPRSGATLSEQSSTSNTPRLFDVGLQPERTLLAWRRTCLSLAAADAVIVKVMALESDVATVAVGVLGLAMPLLAWILASSRYRRSHHGLTRTDAPQGLPPGGPAVFAGTLAALLVGVLALILVVR